MPITLIQTKRGEVRFEYNPPSERVKASRYDRLMDALRTLSDLADEKNPVVETQEWKMAIHGIGGLLKKGFK